MSHTIKKILLIVPPVTVTPDKRNFNVNFPTGLAYIAASLEKKGYDVKVLDAVAEGYSNQVLTDGRTPMLQIGMSFECISEYVKTISPDVVGITGMFSFQRDNYHRLAKAVKDVDRNIIVIMGGAHATADPMEGMSDPNFDYLVIGEGENAVPNLLAKLSSSEDICGLEGIAYRDSGNAVKINRSSSFLDIDKLPWPARNLFPVEKYYSFGQRHGADMGRAFRSLPILTSRGCPFRCCFCSAYQMFGHKYRYRSPEDVLAEIDELVKTLHIEDLYLNDDQFLANKERAIKILDGLIERNYGITLDAPNGLSPWMMDEEIIMKLKKAGFSNIFIAIESGNQWVLDNIINKPVKLDDIPAKVEMLRRNGLKVSVALVIGCFSEKHVETIPQMQDSFDYVEKLDVEEVSVSVLTPHAGSSAYDIGKKRGLIDDKYIDDGYDKSHISTILWTCDELDKFAIIEKILFYRRKSFLVKYVIKPFLRIMRGYCANQRYSLLYLIYGIIGLIKKAKS